MKKGVRLVTEVGWGLGLQYRSRYPGQIPPPCQSEALELLDAGVPKSHPLGGLWAERSVRDWPAEVMGMRDSEGGAAF